MEGIKRVEIIVDRSGLEEVLDLLESKKVSGYTVIEKVQGKGHRGVRDGLGLTDAFSNAMVIWYGRPEEFNHLIDPLREVLSEAGGICAISDAEWLVH